ncbi:uncharacterized protein LOC143834352 isoform X2 [Paroedura picta]|uniref:uncharacterized protein LOC143834352 isoform X2 n=1 Tax=Paroedura picta TaxID=143630 RepID=UPI0040566195
MARFWLALLEMTKNYVFGHTPKKTNSPEDPSKKDQKHCSKSAIPANSSGKDKSSELTEETQNLLHQKVSAVQTPLTSEIQLGEQDANQSEDQIISSRRPKSPTSSDDVNYYSFDDSGVSSDEDFLEDELNEEFAAQTQPGSKIQSGDRGVNQPEEDLIDSPRSTSPKSSEDSSDCSVDPCEEQDLLTHRMECLRQRDQDSLTSGQNEMSALRTPPASEMQPGGQDPNESEKETIRNPGSASPTISEDSIDTLCEQQGLLTRWMESLRQRDQDYSEEGKGGGMTFDPGEDENVASNLCNESRPVYNTKRRSSRKRVRNLRSRVCSVWLSFRRLVRNLWSHVCSIGSSIRGRVRKFWNRACSVWSSFRKGVRTFGNRPVGSSFRKGLGTFWSRICSIWSSFSQLVRRYSKHLSCCQS